MPRILIVINRFTELGGAEGSTAIIVDGLTDRGFEFIVLTLHDLQLRQRAEFERRGVVFIESGPGFVAQLRCVLSAVRRYRPTFIHATLFDADLVSCIVGAFAGVPVLRSIVNTQYDDEAASAVPHRWRLDLVRRLDRLLAHRATFHFHAISNATADAGARAFNVSAAKITVVPRGRDLVALGRHTPERRDAARAALSLDGEAHVLLNVARQEPQKGQSFLLDAFAAVARDDPAAVLLIAGREGSSSELLRRKIQDLGLADRVQLLGVRDDVAELLCAADLFLFSSLWEGLGGAILEAMALGVPVVAFDVPAVSEALGGAGVLVPIRDTGALAACTLDLLADPVQRRVLGERGQEQFEQRFTLERYLHGMDELYEHVASDAARTYRPPFAWLRRRKTPAPGR